MTLSSLLDDNFTIQTNKTINEHNRNPYRSMMQTTIKKILKRRTKYTSFEKLKVQFTITFEKMR
jgi:hypothetical protein